MRHVQEQDEVSLLKSATVDLGEGLYMILMYYHHSDADKSKSFYRCNVRVDTVDNWKNLARGLLDFDPGCEFRTFMIGLGDDYGIYYSRKRFNKADMSKWLNDKLSIGKVKTFDRFWEDEYNGGPKENFLRAYVHEGLSYDISSPRDIPRGVWLTSDKEKRARKKYGTIIH